MEILTQKCTRPFSTWPATPRTDSDSSYDRDKPTNTLDGRSSGQDGMWSFVSLPYLHRSTLPLEFQNTYCGEDLLTQHDEFLKMAHLIDDLEVLLCEAANTYGVQWAEKPLWRTWSLDQFGRFLMLIPRPYVTKHVLLLTRCSPARKYSQPQSFLHSFPNTPARITFTHTSYFPLFEPLRRPLRYLVRRWRDGSHSARKTGMARVMGGLVIGLTGDGHGRGYVRLKWKDGSRSPLN